METSIDSVKFTQLKRLVTQIEEEPVLKDRLDDTDITFEFIIGSLFPKVWDNITDKLKYEHTMGYAEGVAADWTDIDQLYHLSCPECGHIWWTDIAFPNYCPKCGAHRE